MRLAELQAAGRHPQLPLRVTLADGAGAAELRLDSLLRVLPGQRYVGAGEWRGRKVLAKLLVGGKAARHFQRELEGARLLAAQGLTTPALLADGLQEGEGGWLLFDYLDAAQSLGDAWRAVEAQAPLGDAQQAVLGEALAAIGELHAKGLWQDDLHLGNLLRHAGRLYLIDGGGVRAETPGQPLSRQKVLENLGVFFAQLPALLDPFLEELLVHYLLANGEHALPLEALQKEIAKVRRWRVRDLLRKVGRDCSLFSVVRGPFRLFAARRSEAETMAPLLADADRLIAAGHVYKDGGAATVARVEANVPHADHQALQHQGLGPLAEALLAAEPGLGLLARRQPPGIPRHRHRPSAGDAGAALVLAARARLPDYRLSRRSGYNRSF